MDGWMNEKILFGKKVGKKCFKCLGKLLRIIEIFLLFVDIYYSLWYFI